MSKNKLILLSFVVMFNFCYSNSHDEYYCKVDKDKWEVCRRCIDLENDCEGPLPNEDCKCGNVKVANPKTYELLGGYDHCNNGGWCYVIDQSTKCTDKKWANENRKLKNSIWLKNNIATSKQACNGNPENTGNEDVLEGVKILGDQLRNVENGTLTEELKFTMESSEECKLECESRVGKCGAWSYHQEELYCYLHTVNSCCGQFGKREYNKRFISGYTCNVCWSTKGGTDCPCSVEERLESSGIDAGFSEGGKPSLHNGPTGKLQVHSLKLNLDRCQCEKRLFKRRGRELCRCVKTQCKNQTNNSNGTCNDKRRCRTRAYNSERNPKC